MSNRHPGVIRCQQTVLVVVTCDKLKHVTITILLRKKKSKKKQGEEVRVKEKTYVTFVEDFLPITYRDVKNATSNDTELVRVMLYIQTVWPLTCPNPNLASYFARRNELYADGGCIMWGYRMVIPSALRQTVL